MEAQLSDLDLFFDFLNKQLLDNASDNSPLFQPVAKTQSVVTKAQEARFRDGFAMSLGEDGWRRLWLAKDRQGTILGHIDIRHYNQDYKYHRVLLGMGVDTRARRQGIGRQLLEFAIAFCQTRENIEWLDLNLLADNLPAARLYAKCGFKVIGEMVDCYRIDEQSVSEITMTRCTANNI